MEVEARARWRDAVAGVIAKSGRGNPADIPAERLLDSQTYEGFPIHALYTALDALPERPLPGEWPYVRGADGHRDVLTGWRVAEQFPAAGFSGSPTQGNTAVLDALVEGVSALVVRVGDGGVAPADLGTWLTGVYLELAPILLDAGSGFRAAAEAMLALVAASGGSATVSIDLGADPLTAPISGRGAPSVDDVIAVAAAWWPARQATSVDLLEGLSVLPAKPPRESMRGLLVAAVLLSLVAFGCELAMAFGFLPPRASVVSGVVLLLAFVAFTPFFLIPLVRILGRLVPPRWRIEGRLAVEQIVRQPIRTALTAGVLVVAVSNGIGLGHAIRDSVDDVLGWYGKMLRADWVLTQAGALSVSRQDRGAASREMEQEVRGLDGVADVEGIGVATGRISGQVCVVIARDLPSALPLPLAPVDATEADVRQALERGEAVAGTVLAQRTGLKAGDDVVVEVFGRKTPVRVAALVVDYTSGGASLVLRRDAARRLFGMEAADVLLVTAAEGRSPALREPLDAIARKHSMFLRSFGELRGFIDRIVSGVVGSLWSILGLGFVVGSLGVANTVTMSVLEQQRSLGLLRAVGMRRGQVVGMVVLQSVLLGAAAGIVGLVAGVTTALFIQFASQPLLGHPLALHIRPGVVVANLLAALAVTALAAWLPARRAVKLELLEALSTE